MEPAIFVTGAHRSGTTWAGRMLSLPEGVGYIHEPFDPTDRPGTCTGTFHHWYTHVSGEDREVERCVRRALRFHYDPWPRVQSAGAREHSIARDLIGVGYNLCRSLFHRLSGHRPLVKDPLALLSAEWLHDTFGTEVIVLVRHPAAFAGSLKRGQSAFPFEDLLEQERLMATKLAPFRESIAEMTRDEYSVVEQAALLWQCLYHVVSEYRREHPSWQIVRYEDLVQAPVEQFNKLYKAMGLEWTSKVEREVRRRTEARVGRWRGRLTNEEIDFVRDTTRDVWKRFYTSPDWELE